MKKHITSFPRIIVSTILTLALIITAIPAIAFVAKGDTAAGDYLDKELYSLAKSKSFKVKFNANSGKVSKKSKKVSKGKKIGKLPKPTRKGHYFQGWYTKKSGGKKITKASKVTKNKTFKLYAHWSRIPAKYNNKIGKKLGDLKKEDKNFKYLRNFTTEEAAGMVYGNSKSKVGYIAFVGQYEGIPKKHQNNFSKIKNIRVIGIEGPVSAVFPGVKKDMHYKDLLKFLGVKKYNYYPRYYITDSFGEKIMRNGSMLYFKYKGLDVNYAWLDWDDSKPSSQIIKKNHSIHLTINGKSAIYKSNDEIYSSLQEY